MNELEAAERQTKTDLTKTQKVDNSYQKGEVTLRGITITIENPKDSYRTGVNSMGQQWRSKMNFTYGFINESLGEDGDEIDIFLGPLADSNKDFRVFVINQVDPISREFDEHKVMFGFHSINEAREAYLSCYEKGWQGLDSINEMEFKNFASWVKRKRRTYVNKAKTMSEINSDENTKLIKLESEVIAGVTLLELQAQVGDLSSIDTIVIQIRSPGGDINEGIRIMIWFNELSMMGIKIVTLVLANAYSIASLIALAADYILIAKDADIMVHNPMIPEITLANANGLEVYIKDLRALEGIMYELYERFTDLSVEEIKVLMDGETYITAEEAVVLGFADEIVNIEKWPKIMATDKSKLIDMKKVKSTLNVLNRVIAMVGNSNVVNQLYYDNDGGQVEIYQKDQSTYSVGDRVTKEEGTLTLQDGSTLTIADYVITDIARGVIPAASPVASFNEGPAPTAIVEEPSTEVKAPVAIVTEEAPAAEPVAEITPAVEPVAEITPAVEPVAEITPAVEPVAEITPAVEKDDAELMKYCRSLESKISDLEMRFQAFQEAGEMKSQEESSFQELTAQAIDMLAKNTGSNFVPVARVKAEPTPTGSIFQQMRARAEQAKK